LNRRAYISWLLSGLVLPCIGLAADVEVQIAVPTGVDQLPSVAYAIAAGTRYQPPANGVTVNIDQVRKQYAPQVSIIETGTLVAFPNHDNIRHHVYSFSPAKPFELKLYSGKPTSPVLFDRPGVVTLGCNIHDVMLAHVVVVDTPYFAVADAHGLAHLRNLPAGDYLLHAWTPGPHQGEHPVESLRISGGAATLVRAEVPAVAGATP
jgi:plastocyanin